MRRTLAFLAFAISAFAGMPAATQAQLPTFVREISSPPPLISESFGFSFNEFNGNLLVGATWAGGAAYLMDINTGSRLLTLASPDAGRGAISFGRSVAQVGQNIVVGDSEYDASSTARRSGSAYIFSGSTGQHLLTIRNPNPQSFGRFGDAVQSINGNLWINAESTSGNLSGKVHIFSPTSGQLISTISNPEPGPNSSGFGFRFLEHKEDVFISSTRGPFAHIDAGAVYRYDKTSLDLKQKIYNPFPQSETQFGAALADSEKYLLIGAPSYSTSSTVAAGQAYLFSAKTGTLVRAFANPEPEFFGGFGRSVALAGNYAFIGGPMAELNYGGTGPQNVGAFYVFDVNSGAYLGRVVNPEPEQNSGFSNGGGNSGGLAVIGDKLVAASYLNGPGIVYVYSLSGAGPVVIPEPSTFVLLAFGAAIIFARQRKRKTKS